MRQSVLTAALLSAFALPVSAQVVSLPILVPGGPLAGVTTPVFAALPAPLHTSAPLPVDVTVLENGADGSGIGQVLGLAGATVIGNQLNNTLGTPLVGLPRGTAQPIDIAVLGGDGVGNSNATGVAGVAALSGHNVANGGLVGVGVLNRDHSGRGQVLGVAALSGRDSGHASQGLGVGVLNRGEAVGVSVGGNRVLTLAGAAGQARGALPGLDSGGLAVGGGKPVTSRNAVLNAGVLAGDNAGSGGLVGVAALSGNDAANAQLVGVGVLNQRGSGKAVVGVDVLSGDGSGVSSNGAGVAVLSGNGSGNGALAGAGALTGNGSGTGGMVGAGVVSGGDSGKASTVGVAALSGSGSGTGGMAGGNVAGATPSSGAGTGGNGAGGTGDSGSGSGTGGVANPGTGGGNAGNGGTVANGSNGGSANTVRGSGSGNASAGGVYAADGVRSGGTRVAAADVCKVGYKDPNGRFVRPQQCTVKVSQKS